MSDIREALQEAVDYLNGDHGQNSIGASSILHRKMQAALHQRESAPPVAVLEGFEFIYIHPFSRQKIGVVVTREDVARCMPDYLDDMLSEQICRCEPVGETNVVECGCEDYIEGFELQDHAAPKPDHSSEGEKVVQDSFNGDDRHLVACIDSLLAMDDRGALTPHGIGGHARTLLSAAAVRIGRAAPAADGGEVGYFSHKYGVRFKDGITYGYFYDGQPLYTHSAQPRNEAMADGIKAAIEECNTIFRLHNDNKRSGCFTSELSAYADRLRSNGGDE